VDDEEIIAMYKTVFGVYPLVDTLAFIRTVRDESAMEPVSDGYYLDIQIDGRVIKAYQDEWGDWGCQIDLPDGWVLMRPKVVSRG
jgi:hypothetical protein